ncbi:hypothetical protein HYDPIDRAFT_165191 [Hydnomerulius pinastri MD-312]|nr:hypothetical protein HYDPIDRAFT_165191 [Hydnomerulius pinastri MD-312]
MSMSSFNYRRRSHSASSPSPSPAPASVWRPAHKRAHSSHRNSPGITDSPSSQRCNVDSWRTGKRRRRDYSPSRDTGRSTPSSTDSHSSGSISSAPHTPPFPASSADFLLFPGRSAYRGNGSAQSRSPSSLASSLPDDPYESSESELARLRSEAFWELQRSVEENGEGFVKRMRELEDSRAKSAQHSRARGIERRRRKRYSPSVPTTRKTKKASGSDNDDDDVLILSSDVIGGSIFHPKQKRASSLGAMVVDNDTQAQEEALLSPVSRNLSIIHPFSFKDTCHDHTHTSNHNHIMEPYTSSNSSPESTHPAYTNAFTQSPSHSSPKSFNSPLNVFSPSFPSRDNVGARMLVPVPSPTASSDRSSFDVIPSSSSRTEKAIAALTLAMANGAGGLGDYEAVRALDNQCTNESQVGELWH